MMHGFGDGFGMGYGWIFMILFWVVVIFLVVALAKQLGSRGGQETAEDILKKRYARGEFTKEEFEARRKDLRE